MASKEQGVTSEAEEGGRKGGGGTGEGTEESEEEDNESELRSFDTNEDDVHAVYKVPSKLKNVLSKAELHHIRTAFREVDTDGSGSIDVKELKHLFETLDGDIEDAKIISYMKEFDKDENGTIDFGEFVDMLERQRRNDPTTNHFANLVSKINMTPTCALEKACRRQNLKATYRLVDETKETSMTSKTYAFECVITGEFSNVLDGDVVVSKESRKFFGSGPSTRIARFKAAARALKKIQANIPGATSKPGKLPPDWFEWGRENVRRGVPSELVCKTLVSKGFFPAKNEKFMQTILVVANFRMAKGSIDAVPIVETDRFLPTFWNTWAHGLVARGFDGSVVLNILERNGYDAKKDPQFAQNLESNRYFYEKRPYAIQGRDASFDFCAAVLEDDVLSQKIYVAGGQNVNASLSWPNGMRCPALIAAVRRNLSRTTKWLLAVGADVNCKDQFDRTALYYATEGKTNVSMILRRLLDGGSRISSLDSYDNTVLHVAAMRGNHEMLRELLKFSTKKLRDLCTSVKFRAEITALFEMALKKRLSKYERQRFKKKWTLSVVKEYYTNVMKGPRTASNALARDILLPPQIFVVRRCMHHYDREPDIPFIDVDKFVTMVGHIVRENLINWKNRAGKTALAVAVKPDGRSFDLKQQETCKLLLDDFGAYVGKDAIDGHGESVEQILVAHYFERKDEGLVHTSAGRPRDDVESDIMEAPPTYVKRPWYWLLRRSIYLGALAGWEERIHPKTGRRFYVSFRDGRSNDIYYGDGLTKTVATAASFGPENLDEELEEGNESSSTKDHRVVWEKPDAVLEFEGAAGGKGSKHRWQYRLRHAVEVRTVSVWRELKFRDEPVFYMNLFTKKCQYDIPTELQDLEHVEQLDGDKSMVDTIEASLNTGLIRRGRQKKKGRLKERKSDPFVTDKVGFWEEVWDPDAGDFYYRKMSQDEEGEDVVDTAQWKCPLAFVWEDEQVESVLSRRTDVYPPHLRGRHHAVLCMIRGARARFENKMVLCEWGCGCWMRQGEKMRNHEKEECMMRITKCNFDCPLKMQACEWIHKRAGHEKVCPRRLVPCPQGCECDVVFEELEEHVKTLCPKRPFPVLPCKYNCGVVFKGTWDIQEHIETEKLYHESEGCPERKVRCSWTGCMLEVKAKDMREHRRQHLNEKGVKTWNMAGVYTYKVPLNQRMLKVQLWGAGGGAGHLKGQYHGPGFGGGFVECVIEVYPGETLTITVGEGGRRGVYGKSQHGQTTNQVEIGVAKGGRPGGGDGVASYVQWACGAGGGFSCIQRNTPRGGLELVVLAGGGGGGAHPLFTGDTGGRSGTNEAGGKGGGRPRRVVDGAHATGLGGPGESFQGGSGVLLGAGGGGGFYGGGAGGFIPGFAGPGGNGSSYVYKDMASDIVVEYSSGQDPPGISRGPPKARGAFVWDVLESCSGRGGQSSSSEVHDGSCGAVRVICRRSRRGKWWV